MGHAPKKVDAIPTQMVVDIYAWEGLLYEANRKMTELLKAILEGDDSSDKWNQLDSTRKQVIFYNQQYTKAILKLQISQNRG